MTDQAGAGSPPAREKIALEARMAAAAAVLRVARETGSTIVSRPVWPGAASSVDYAEPGAGLAIARALERAAASVTSSYIRFARETGRSWRDIGTALELGPDDGGPDDGGADGGGADGAEERLAVARAAFEFAAGQRGDDSWQFSTPTFRWSCLDCEQTIIDHGPSHDYPEDNERGHSADCRRLAAAVAAWRAHWASQSDG